MSIAETTGKLGLEDAYRSARIEDTIRTLAAEALLDIRPAEIDAVRGLVEHTNPPTNDDGEMRFGIIAAKSFADPKNIALNGIYHNAASIVRREGLLDQTS